MSHLGRPKGERNPKFSLKPVSVRLGELINKDVKFVDDCIGDEVNTTVSAMKPGDVLLLENVRFHKGETKNDEAFSEELANLMHKAGCVGIDFTVDSGNDGQLQRLGHLHRVSDITGLARLCHRCGFSFMFDLLLGGPGETRQTVKETLELMKGLEPTQVGISLGVRLYPDTPLGKMVKGFLYCLACLTRPA